jgi:hypothetical protein
MDTRAPKPKEKIGPLFDSTRFKDTKDPCIVFDGTLWHIFGSGGTVITEEWNILHATAENIEGPWTEEEPVKLIGIEGFHIAAPGAVFDTNDKLFHMAIQRDFMAVGGGIEYLVSSDGKTFTWVNTLLDPLHGSSEAGLYDPHLALIGGKKYLIYSGIPAILSNDRPFIPQPDVYIAESISGLWAGPWRRCKKILDHDEIGWHHNKREHPDYEWGIEGPQLLELPNGKILLNATCFIEEGRRGTRQRVFFAIADSPTETFVSLGPVLSDRENEWESGENGHATAVVCNDFLYLFYQARSQSNPDPRENNWRYGIAKFSLADFL